MKHCGGRAKKLATFKLKKPGEFSAVYLHEYHCGVCRQSLYYWDALTKEGDWTGLSKISQREYERVWLPKLGPLDALNAMSKEMRAKIHAGDFTMKASRPADVAMSYLERVGSA